MGEVVDKLKCPSCEDTNFLEGPHGGAAVNVKCAGCGHTLNVSPLPEGRTWIVDDFGRPNK